MCVGVSGCGVGYGGGGGGDFKTWSSVVGAGLPIFTST